VSAGPAGLEGRSFGRGDDGYEEARRATVWNARIPDRFPDVVVQAETEGDVVAAVRFAGERSLPVGVRSGGHSWAANHLRDGGLLLDVSRLRSVQIDAASMTASVGPGMSGHELVARLEAEGLFFPAGHCAGVALGGYLLQGGFGWNGRALGPACESVVGIDVVTADGSLVHADTDRHADLYWAARGAGPGFFGAVTRFHLRLHQKPKAEGTCVAVYPMAVIDELYSWARSVCPEVDRRVEMQLLMSADFSDIGVAGPGVMVVSSVFAESHEEGRRVTAFLNGCPVLGRSLRVMPYEPMPLAVSYELVKHAYPDGRRYAADNMWTSASAEALLPAIHHIAETIPPAPSHFLWLNWGPSPPREDMAYSVEDEVYLALYSVWRDPADDARYADWPVSHMGALEHLASGIQLADENLGQRPARFAADGNLARLDALRSTYDPLGRFHSWMGRP
jgi:FAD/FMN-containing dehydrogenase